ncbi:hypothetical protein C8R45DRAFT_1137889 [Mycena sanguinolenta]|nr:hypothetical protein C8R45DRAFT_1137889 [Mycena sanguinolenta]
MRVFQTSFVLHPLPSPRLFLTIDGDFETALQIATPYVSSAAANSHAYIRPVVSLSDVGVHYVAATSLPRCTLRCIAGCSPCADAASTCIQSLPLLYHLPAFATGLCSSFPIASLTPSLSSADILTTSNAAPSHEFHFPSFPVTFLPRLSLHVKLRFPLAIHSWGISSTFCAVSGLPTAASALDVYPTTLRLFARRLPVAALPSMRCVASSSLVPSHYNCPFSFFPSRCRPFPPFLPQSSPPSSSSQALPACAFLTIPS